MSSITTSPNKRKAADLIEGDAREELAEDEKILLAALRHLTERVVRVDELLVALTKRVNGIDQQNSFDQWLEAILGAQDCDEDLSDIEESDIDESDKWAIMFQQLRCYKMNHGDCKVPTTFKENPKLGKWVAFQKFTYNNLKTGKGQKISSERIEKLESLGFAWGKKYPEPPSWEFWFEKLQEHKKRTGNCNVHFNASHPTPLAKWVAYQRTEYRRLVYGRDSLLDLEKAQQLKDLGIKWKGPRL